MKYTIVLDGEIVEREVDYMKVLKAYTRPGVYLVFGSNGDDTFSYSIADCFTYTQIDDIGILYGILIEENEVIESV